jgi:acetoin utilization deacetylase AcuC-like enzyme
MKVFYSPVHREHTPFDEFPDQPKRVVELPARVEGLRDEIERRGIGPIAPPDDFGFAPILRVHDKGLMRFLTWSLGDLSTSWRLRQAGEVALGQATEFPPPEERFETDADGTRKPRSYAFYTGTPIVKGTRAAALAAVNAALSAAHAVKDGAPAAFALARPPGHHATYDQLGGYCYLNNMAIAAQWLADAGLRPAILDVDYHHGNGTQSIFYDRADVLFCSIHRDPSAAFPYFAGFAGETGIGAGEGKNLNLPMPANTSWHDYEAALARAVSAIEAHGPDVLLVSLGLDTFESDPIADFKFRADDYFRLGAALAKIGRPTVFILEGGYNLNVLPVIAANTLEGFEAR